MKLKRFLYRLSLIAYILNFSCLVAYDFFFRYLYHKITAIIITCSDHKVANYMIFKSRTGDNLLCAQGNILCT